MQHDLRKLPLPFDDEEFDVVDDEEFSIVDDEDFDVVDNEGPSTANGAIKDKT